MIDMIMTAVIRPKVIEKTLASLRRNLVTERKINLVINLDPIGEAPSSVPSIIEIVKYYFPNAYIYQPLKADHVEAFKWCWEKISTSFGIFWEDDYVLREPIYLDYLIHIMNETPKIGQIHFDRKDKSILTYPGYRRKFSPFSKYLLERRIGKSIGGPPSLLRKEYITQILPHISLEPDICSRRKCVKEILKEWRFLTYLGALSKGSLVEDIGTEWRKEQGLAKVKQPKGLIWKIIKAT